MGVIKVYLWENRSLVGFWLKLELELVLKRSFLCLKTTIFKERELDCLIKPAQIKCQAVLCPIILAEFCCSARLQLFSAFFRGWTLIQLILFCISSLVKAPSTTSGRTPLKWSPLPL